MRVRPFDRQRDLREVLALVGRTRARGDAGVVFHPGGLQWWLRRMGRPGFEVAVLANDASIAGFLLRDRGDVLLQTDGHDDRRGDLLAWGETRARESGQPEVLVSVAEQDVDLRDLLLSRGYGPSDRRGYELVRQLDVEPGPPELPRGCELISLTPELTDAYIALHRAAWTRPNAPSTYDREQHDLVAAMPDFRSDLVPIVRTADGALAAYCISWWDPRSRSVEIEPLGTHPEHRRRGLARAIVVEVMRRAWTLGASYVLVWGTTENPEARALYESAGMRARRVLRDYRLVFTTARAAT